MNFRWHVLSECPDEDTCPVHGPNEPPPPGVTAEQDLAWREMVALGEELGT